MSVLITGCCGFIGFHLASYCLQRGEDVVGIDNFNDYYSVQLKRDRCFQLEVNSKNISSGRITVYESDITDVKAVSDIFARHKPDYVVNLAAQAGVRYSISNPSEYISSNIQGFANILELCRAFKVRHLLYASSSSVYGGTSRMPLVESSSTDHPLSLYAATKKSNELMAHSYSNLFSIPTSGLRFFTVYGPWGRPDMALFKFTDSIVKGHPIQLYNNGDMIRDFTYIDDIVKSVYKLIYYPPSHNSNFNFNDPLRGESWAPFIIYNIGRSNPVTLSQYVDELEQALHIKALRTYLPMQDGDVYSTHADTNKLFQAIGFVPQTTLKSGIKSFVDWYKSYYQV